MTRFTTCPGEGCDSKVVAHDLDNNTAGVNFCCVPCWSYTWAFMSDESFDPTATWDHSQQCVRRQAVRADVEVEEIDGVRVMGPSITSM